MSGLAGLKGVPRKGAPFSLWAVLFLFGLVSGVEAQPCLPFQVDEWAEVSYVYDGDTVRLSDGRKVRLIGINTPEIGHDGQVSEPLGDAARQALQGLLVGQPQVALRYEEDRRDRYGRLLAHLYLLDQRNVQELLLERGLAAAVAVAPNFANLECYFAAEARANGAGIWQQRRFSAYESGRLPREARGFYIVQGVVERIGESRQALWLNLPNRVVVRVDKRLLPWFTSEFDPGQLQGSNIRVRGWLSEWRGSLQMRVDHPVVLQRLDE